MPSHTLFYNIKEQKMLKKQQYNPFCPTPTLQSIIY